MNDVEVVLKVTVPILIDLSLGVGTVFQILNVLTQIQISGPYHRITGPCPDLLFLQWLSRYPKNIMFFSKLLLLTRTQGAFKLRDGCKCIYEKYGKKQKVKQNLIFSIMFKIHWKIVDSIDFILS